MTTAAPWDGSRQRSFEESLPITKALASREEQCLWDHGPERNFLATLFRKPELMAEALRSVQPSMLFSADYRYLYEVMVFSFKYTSERGWPIQFDHVSLLTVARSVSDEVARRFVDRHGIQIAQSVESILHEMDPTQFHTWVSRIRDTAKSVEIYRSCRMLQVKVLDRVKSPDPSAVAMQGQMQFTAMAFDTSRRADSAIAHISQQEDAVIEKSRINWAYRNAGVNLFSVPFTHIPTWAMCNAGGFRRGGLTTVVARPKTGKTTLLMNLALNVASVYRYPVLYIDNEMTREELYIRDLTQLSGVREGDILSGRMFGNAADGGLSDEDRAALVASMRQMRDYPVYYINVAGQHPSAVVAAMRQFRHEVLGTMTLRNPETGDDKEFSRPGLVLFDWLKIPDPGAMSKSTAEWQALGFLASQIKDAAAMLDIPVVAGAQANRMAAGKDAEDYESDPDAFVGGSDRLNMFSTSVVHLRNITGSERAKMIAEGVVRPEWDAVADPSSRSATAVNQFLYIRHNRNGATNFDGIPLFHDFGRYVCSEASADPLVIGWLSRRREARRNRAQQSIDREGRAARPRAAVGGA
jgi:hypothetical protein